MGHVAFAPVQTTYKPSVVLPGRTTFRQRREMWEKRDMGTSVLIPKYPHEMELWSLKNLVASLRIFPMPRSSFPTSAWFVGREVTGVSGVELKLNGAPVTVTTTSLLAPGTYVLVAAGGSAIVSGDPGAFTVNGLGVDGIATLTVSQGQLVLTWSLRAIKGGSMAFRASPTSIPQSTLTVTGCPRELNSWSVAIRS